MENVSIRNSYFVFFFLISEYYAAYLYSEYWKYLQMLKDIDFSLIEPCSKEDYDIGLHVASQISPSQVANIKLSLSMHERSPKLEFISQLYFDLKRPEPCSHPFLLEGDMFCDMSALKQRLERKQPSKYLEHQKWDRIYNISGLNPSAVLVYYFQDFQHKEFNTYHSELVSMSDAGKIRYVFMNVAKTRCNAVADLAGFASVLYVKDAAYRVVNDQPINLFGESIPEILTNYVSSKEDTTVQTVNDKEELSEYFFAAIKYLSEEHSNMKLDLITNISLNFPSYVSALSKMGSTYNERRDYYQHLQTYVYPEMLETESIFINGIHLQNDISAFELIPLLSRELKSLEALTKIGFSADEARKILLHGISETKYKFKLDIRSNLIQWLNNIEKDARYQAMSPNINQINYYHFGEQVYPIRLNIFNVVIFINPNSHNFYPTVSMVQKMINNNLPLRFGYVLVTDMDDEISRTLSRALISLARNHIDIAADFVAQLFDENQNLTVEKIVTTYKKFKPYQAIILTEVEHEVDTHLQELNKFFESVGLSKHPSIVFNGEIVDFEEINSNLFYTLMSMYHKMVEEIRHRLNTNDLKIQQKTEDTFMSGANFYKRINMNLFDGKRDVFYLQPFSPASCEPDNLETLSTSQLYHCLIQRNVFVSNSNRPKQTIWLVLNLETDVGVDIFKNLLSKDYTFPVRFGIIFSQIPSTTTMTFTDKVYYYINKTNPTQKNILSFLNNDSSSNLNDLDIKTLRQELAFQSNFKRVFNIFDAANYAIHGVSKYGPIKHPEEFTADDLSLCIDTYKYDFEPLYKDSLREIIVTKSQELSIYSSTDLNDLIINYLAYRVNERLYRIHQLRAPLKSFIVRIKPDSSQFYLNVDAAINPVSLQSQKLISFLNILRSSFNCDLRIYLVHNEYASHKAPNRYYRFVLNPEVDFSKRKVNPFSNTAVFDELSPLHIYTLQLETHQSWFVQSLFANGDMDNIYFSDLPYGCIGQYELEYLMVEGHAFNVNRNQPASGLKLVLGTINQPEMFDTIVMQNLGYFQLKGQPGAFYLTIKIEEPPQPFMIKSITSLNSGSADIIIIDNFIGNLIRVEIVEHQISHTHPVPDEIPRRSFWSRFSNLLSTKTEIRQSKNYTNINVFTVATGLLYERFARIMILSVLEHTKVPVKFWFLKNYLSPQFKHSIKILSNALKFEYEYVQYQWPHWLLRQSDKQRTIWGYKILFLDVLFPLDVDRIIFVDSDQIVRADLNELNNINLGDAPYAYTPFCNDRPEMARFRFWESGYWKDHLAGRPYHISALSLIDLKVFRSMFAGDKIRGQYQMLSRDPNSLANLDQDLPNNLQHIIRIKSLPIEWLWCETWCSDKSKSRAKTIDMCNNPLTHEAKLDRAKRIAPEFTKYDILIENILHPSERTLSSSDL